MEGTGVGGDGAGRPAPRDVDAEQHWVFFAWTLLLALCVLLLLRVTSPPGIVRFGSVTSLPEKGVFL